VTVSTTTSCHITLALDATAAALLTVNKMIIDNNLFLPGPFFSGSTAVSLRGVTKKSTSVKKPLTVLSEYYIGLKTSH
jgi:hypothetical protein